MKRLILISTVLLTGLSLSACGNNSNQAASSSDSSKESSLKAANSSLKKKISQQKKQSSRKNNTNGTSDSSDAASSNANQEASNASTSSTTTQQAQNNNGNGTINSPDEAVAAAKAKYGDNNGDYMWGAMSYDDNSYRYPDGSYFVKAISRQQLNDGSMTGTAKSVMVHPDGSITEN